VWGRRQVFYNKEIPVPREGDEIKETISSWALRGGVFLIKDLEATVRRQQHKG